MIDNTCTCLVVLGTYLYLMLPDIYNPVEKSLKGTIGFEIEDMGVQ